MNPKSLSSTRWESHINSIKSISAQILNLREALLEMSEKDFDSKIRIEAKFLATNKLGNFEFLMTTIIWFELFFAVNFVSKLLQSKDMFIDVVIKKIKGLILFFMGYRETGFNKALGYMLKKLLLN